MPKVQNTEQRVGSPAITTTLNPWIGRQEPVCKTSEWNTNKPIATSTIAIGNICQKSLKENSVTAFVIGTGPVNVILIPKSSHVHKSAEGCPLLSQLQALSSFEMSLSISCVCSITSFAVFSSSTAIIITALSKNPSPSVSLVNLSRPGEGVPSSSYISFTIVLIVCWLGIE